MNFLKTSLALAFAVLFASVSASAEGKKLTVYNLTDTPYRFDAFTKKTGVVVEVEQGDSVFEIMNKNLDSNPDLVIQDDALEFITLKNQGLLQTIASQILEENIPAQFRDLKSGWVGMSFRGRILAYNPNFYTPPAEIRYEDLAKSEFKDKLCLRNSSYSFSRGMLSSLILADGFDAALSIVKGWLNNTSQPIFERDLFAVQALESGQCGLVFVNSDFFAKYLLKSQTKLQAIWPNQGDRGTHVNVVGMGLMISSQDAELATRLLNFIATDEQSHLGFAAIKQSFPTNLKFFSRSDAGRRFGQVKWDKAPLSKILELDEQSRSLATEANY